MFISRGVLDTVGTKQEIDSKESLRAHIRYILRKIKKPIVRKSLER